MACERVSPPLDFFRVYLKGNMMRAGVCGYLYGSGRAEGRKGRRGGGAQKERVREITAQRSTWITKCKRCLIGIVFEHYVERCGARLKLTLNPHPL